jgi:hypothetical protein
VSKINDWTAMPEASILLCPDFRTVANPHYTHLAARSLPKFLDHPEASAVILVCLVTAYQNQMII